MIEVGLLAALGLRRDSLRDLHLAYHLVAEVTQLSAEGDLHVAGVQSLLQLVELRGRAVVPHFTFLALPGTPNRDFLPHVNQLRVQPLANLSLH